MADACKCTLLRYRVFRVVSVVVLMVFHKRTIAKVAPSSLATRTFRNVRVHPLVPGVLGLHKRFIAEAVSSDLENRCL